MTQKAAGACVDPPGPPPGGEKHKKANRCGAGAGRNTHEARETLRGGHAVTRAHETGAAANRTAGRPAADTGYTAAAVWRQQTQPPPMRLR